MARKKSAAAAAPENQTHETDAGQETAAPTAVEAAPAAPAPKPIKKHVTQQVRYTVEEMPPPPDYGYAVLPVEGGEDGEEGEDGGASEFDEAEEQAAIIDDFESTDSDDYYIRVFRLPSFAKDGRAGLRNTTREFCDDLPLTNDYLAVIRDAFGPGMYQLELRQQAGHRIKRRKNVRIAAPMRAGNPATPANAHPAPVIIEQPAAPPPAPVDPMKAVRDSIKLAKEMREAFGEPAHAPQPAPVDPTIAALQLLITQKDSVPDLVKKLFDVEAETPKPSWIENVFAMAAPLLTPLVQAYIGGSLNAQAPGTPQPNEAPQLQPGDAPPTTSVNAGHGPEQPASTEQRLWQFIAECCAESYPVESAAEQINSFVAQHPELGSTVDDVATASANGALLMLRGVAPQVAARPGAKDWLQALQMALQTESVEAQQ